MDDTEIERRIRQAGYDVQREKPDANGVRWAFALRDGKRHTRAFETLLELGEHLGRVERPVRFVEDAAAIEAAIANHTELRGHFTIRSAACRVAVFNGLKYVELVSSNGAATAVYELRPEGLRKVSRSNLPPEIVAALAAPQRPR